MATPKVTHRKPPRTRPFQIRLNDAESERLEAFATKYGVPYATVLRAGLYTFGRANVRAAVLDAKGKLRPIAALVPVEPKEAT